MSSRRFALLIALLGCLALPLPVEAKEPAFPFVAWTDSAFDRARREKRVILVMVSTSWCHWCHVMKRETYAHPAVRTLLAQRFLPIYVDADARPDLAERFRNYRWPATGFLTSNAQPIQAIRGYRSPTAFLTLLRNVLRTVKAGGPFPGFKDPNTFDTVPGAADNRALVQLNARLEKQLQQTWDPIHLGWGRPQKYPIPEPIEYALRLQRARTVFGSSWERRGAWRDRGRQALAAQGALLDREWGGVYQYSVGPSWDRWHPEKIMSVNAGALTNYALAGQLENARLVRRWFRDFLTDPAGGFYTSQDADAPRLAGEKFYRLSAKARAPFGVPRVDPSIYARENGIAIQAHCAFARAADDAEARAAAVAAATQILRTHRNPDGTFRHAAAPSQRLFLVDQVEMARAFLALYALTLEQPWLDEAARTSAALVRRFGRQAGGFYDATASNDPGVFAERIHSLESNAAAARLLLDLGAVQGDALLRERGRQAIASVAGAARVKGHWRYVGGLLIAGSQALLPVVRIDVRGREGPPMDALLAYARKLADDPTVYLHRTVDTTPPSAVLCSDGTCSEPAADPAALYARMVALHGLDSAPYLEGVSPAIR